MDEKSQENSFIGKNSVNKWDFHGKNWFKILEARIGGGERRREKDKNSSKFLQI